MLYNGREVDPLSLWSQFVDFPPGVEKHLGGWLPNVKCPNPAHQTEKKNFGINTARDGVHCFTRCGISGSWEHAISIIKGCDEREARRLILRHTRVPVGGIKDSLSFSGTRKRIDAEDEISRDEVALSAGRFSFLPKPAIDYLSSRGIDQHAILKWNLGYDDEHERIAIPARDSRQVFRFLIRRSVGHQQPKYLYTPGAIKSNILFGACYLDRSVLLSLGLVLVEGSLDTIRLHSHGITSAVGTLGSGLSKRQVRMIDNIRPRRIYCFYDKDYAGVENTLDARAKLSKYPIFVCRYPADKSDPAELTKREVEKAIDRALPVGQFTRNVREVLKRR